MVALLNSVDSDGLLEYSVVYTERALNHMSKRFQGVMRDISSLLKEVYHAESVAIVPGGSSYGMEAVVRQFARGARCLTLQNGFSNLRWSKIFQASELNCEETILKAERLSEEKNAAFIPASIEIVREVIDQNKSQLVFATHIETSTGIMLSNDYIQQIADAIHRNNGLLILDCIASGAIWIDMEKLGVDVLITAPQKGWTGTPSAGLVMFSKRALNAMESAQSDSFCLNLKKWLDVMRCYEESSRTYNASMPTDSLNVFRDVMLESRRIGFSALSNRQIELGRKARAVLKEKGFISMAADGFESPCVIVCYTNNFCCTNFSDVSDDDSFLKSDDLNSQTFRLGLFGLDKLINIDRTIDLLRDGLNHLEHH